MHTCCTFCFKEHFFKSQLVDKLLNIKAVTQIFKACREISKTKKLNNKEATARVPKLCLKQKTHHAAVHVDTLGWQLWTLLQWSGQKWLTCFNNAWEISLKITWCDTKVINGEEKCKDLKLLWQICRHKGDDDDDSGRALRGSLLNDFVNNKMNTEEISLFFSLNFNSDESLMDVFTL